MKLHTIIASTRPKRLGGQVGRWFGSLADEHDGVDHKLVDLREVGLPFLDEPEHPSTGRYVLDHTKEWSALIDAAEAYVFVTPEYNSGIPAPLKNALDFLFHEWAHKPVGFVSYGGLAAGTRGVQMTKQILAPLKLHPTSATVAIPARTYVDKDRVFQPDERLTRSANRLLAELASSAPIYAQLRDS